MKTHLGSDQTGPTFSFSQLLELPPTQAAKLLHSPENLAAPATGVLGNYPLLRTQCRDVKQELLDLGSNSSYFDPTVTSSGQKSTKRKGREKRKDSKKKKNKTSGEGEIDEEEKLPYVHVRAPRGQATNRHSLAERARREKINARMKLLEELVPGCNKISGTALVLDEIINHVQSLQRQVEFLSMRLATVNPIIDINIDNLLAAQAGSSMDGNLNMFMPLMWPDGQVSMTREQYPQLSHFNGLHFPAWEKEEKPNFITPENSLPSYVSSTNSASLLTSQIQKET